MQRRPTRAELEAENVVLFDELVAIRDRLDTFLSDDEEIEGEDEAEGRPVQQTMPVECP